MIRRTTILLLFVVALAGLGACSEDNKVGSGVKVDKNAAGSNSRLGATTTTAAAAAAPTTAAPAAAPTTTAAPATTAAPKPTPTTAAPTTTVAQATAFEIAIYGDNSGQRQFEPPQAAVRLGTVVRWVNKDSVARSVESAEAGFQSPSIPPGGSWDFKTDTKGTFNYQDGTRPYAVGVLQVG